MIKIMFVCYGNICRSPMAEFIFKDMLRKRGREDGYYVASGATSNEEIYNGVGNPVYPPAKRELEKHRIFCGERQAVRIERGDYEKYDLIVCMDSENVHSVLRIFGGDPERKVQKLMDFTGCGRDVADPWYSGRFDIAYNDIFMGCKALIEFTENKRMLKS